MKILRFLKVWIMDLIKVGSFMRPKKNATQQEAGRGFANSAAAQASVNWENVNGRPTKLSQFENDPKFVTTAMLKPIFDVIKEDEEAFNTLTYHVNDLETIITQQQAAINLLKEQMDVVLQKTGISKVVEQATPERWEELKLVELSLSSPSDFYPSINGALVRSTAYRYHAPTSPKTGAVGEHKAQDGMIFAQRGSFAPIQDGYYSTIEPDGRRLAYKSAVAADDGTKLYFINVMDVRAGKSVGYYKVYFTTDEFGFAAFSDKKGKPMPSLNIASLDEYISQYAKSN